MNRATSTFVVLARTRVHQQLTARLCSNDSCSSGTSVQAVQHKQSHESSKLDFMKSLPTHSTIILPKHNQKLHLVNHKRLFSMSRHLSMHKGVESASDETGAAADEEIVDDEVDTGDEEPEEISEGQFVDNYYDPRNRTRKITADLSINYMESAAYRITYGEDPVWKHYRRNMKAGSQWMPNTRRKCIRHGKITIASPCPICRDMYLLIDYRNTKLLDQFVDKYSGVVYGSDKTGLCQEQMEKLMIQIEKAKDYGLLDLDATQVYYDDNIYKKLL